MEIKLIFLILLISIFLISGCTETPHKYSQSESRQIAKQMLEGSPMYKFDGFDLNLIEANPQNCVSCYEFKFNFKNKHPGYGDRAGQMLAQVITSHKAVLKVVNGSVTYAVVDNVWDILAQDFLA